VTFYNGTAVDVVDCLIDLLIEMNGNQSANRLDDRYNALLQIVNRTKYPNVAWVIERLRDLKLEAAE